MDSREGARAARRAAGRGKVQLGGALGQRTELCAGGPDCRCQVPPAVHDARRAPTMRARPVARRLRLNVSTIRQRLATILAADVAGYSRLMGCDECGTVAALDEARAVFRRAIGAHQGRVIDM